MKRLEQRREPIPGNFPAGALLALAALLIPAACSAATTDDSGLRNGTAETGGTGGSGGSTIDPKPGGTGGVPPGTQCAGVSEEASNAVLPVDVVWTIDTSGSMLQETSAVRQNMNQFSDQISKAGVDARIILIAEKFGKPPIGFGPDLGICIDSPLGSGSCPNDTNLPGFAHVYQKVSSRNSLAIILSEFPNYRDALRPGSLKIFTVVTDDDSDLSAQAFTQQVEQLDAAYIKPMLWKLYGIFCFTDCPQAARPGTVYQQLVTQTGGVAGDLCKQDFKPVFDSLAQSIVAASKLSCGWTIPAPPSEQTFNKGEVNVVFTPGTGPAETFGKVGSAAECGPAGGWYYDDEINPGTVLVCPTTCQSIQADPLGKIEVQFGCSTVVIPK